MYDSIGMTVVLIKETIHYLGLTAWFNTPLIESLLNKVAHVLHVLIYI